MIRETPETIRHAWVSGVFLAASLGATGCPERPSPAAPAARPSPSAPPEPEAGSRVDASVLEAKLPAGWVDKGYWLESRTFAKPVEGDFLNRVVVDDFPLEVPQDAAGYGALALKDSRAATLGSVKLTDLDPPVSLGDGWLLTGHSRDLGDKVTPAFLMKLVFSGKAIRVVGHFFADEATRAEGIALAKSLVVPANTLDLAKLSVQLPPGWTKSKRTTQTVRFVKMVQASEFHANAVVVDRLPRTAPAELDAYAALVLDKTRTGFELAEVLGSTDQFEDLSEKKPFATGWYFTGRVKDAVSTGLRPAFVVVLDVSGTKVRARSQDVAPELMGEALELAKSLQ